MIGISFNGGDAVRARLAAIPGDAEAALLHASTDLVDQIQSAVEGNLSGGVLQTRSGKLRDSLAVTASASGPRIDAGISSNVPYAAFQEFGFSGTESIREFLRRQTMAFGRAITPKEVRVRAHDRRMDYSGRSYLRSALAEIAPTIRDVLSGAMAEVLGS